MKKIKHTILSISALLLFVATSMQAQDQMYWVHVDHVKPAMQGEYEKVAKAFADACKTNNLQDFEFNTWRQGNGSYVSSSPIKNFADMDKETMKTLSDKMGKEKFQAMFDGFDKCYDKHNSFIATYKSELSYIPTGKLAEGNFTKYHFFYVTPSNSKAVAAKLKEIKELFAKKGAKEYYVILHSGFGASEEFYVAIVDAKDQMDYEKTSIENDKIMGEDWGKKWGELYALLHRYETETAMYRSDLSYKATK
jgi:hypothetical protein